jgi:hypothetical protein
MLQMYAGFSYPAARSGHLAIFQIEVAVQLICRRAAEAAILLMSLRQLFEGLIDCTLRGCSSRCQRTKSLFAA